MGLRSSVNVRRTSAPGSRQLVRLGVDVPLLLLMLTLLVAGLLMVYSASWDFSLIFLEQPPTYIFSRQIRWMVLGVAIAVVLAFVDYHYWQRVAVPMLAVTVAALAVVLVINEVRHGAARTLLGGSYQPSELAKLVIIIYLSVWLYAKRDYLAQVGFGLFPLASILGLVGGLIYLQPDLSAVMTVVALGGILFFLAGGDLKQIVLMGLVAGLVGWLVVQASPTGSARVASYLEGIKDPTLASYHVRRSLEAFVKGGWLGRGIGKANTKLTGLPWAHTDSIFAVVGEETGVLGAVTLVGFYGLLLWRGLVIARRAPDLLGSLLAAGLSMWLVLEAFVNMAVIVGLLPFAGNALPFISAGGSNLLVSLAAIGIIMNVERLSNRQAVQTTQFFSAVVDLRRRRKLRQQAQRSRSTSRRTP